jgi:hypothetical protein
MSVFREFHGRGNFEKSINATFISLIPNKAGAVDVKDFHHISLVGEKIISTVLASRLKKVFEKIISSPKMHLSGGDRYLIQFWLPLNVWMVEFDQATLVRCVNWT